MIRMGTAIGSLGVNGVVVETEHLADFIAEFWLLTSPHVRPKGLRHGALRSLIIGLGQNCSKTPPISHYQGKMANESMVSRQKVSVLLLAL
jgi:hypothetical protein